jgi:hypothetical protein
MPNRTCDACGKNKDVQGGKTCPRGHFVCKDDVWAGTGGGFFGNGLKNCPICKEGLR